MSVGELIDPVTQLRGTGGRLLGGLRTGGTRLQAAVDCSAWCLALLVVWRLSDTPWGVSSVLLTAVAVSLLQLAVGWWLGLYRRRYVYASFTETGWLLAVSGLAGLVLTLGAAKQAAPALLATFTAVGMMAGSRYLVRLSRDRAARPAHGQPVIVLGAGAAGVSLVRQMLTDPDSAYLPVGIVDDDRSKHGLRVEGVRVLGAVGELVDIAVRLQATGVIVAIAGTDATFLRSCRRRLDGTGIWLRTIPSLAELIDRKVVLDDIRNLDVEDLIGRKPLTADLTEIGRSIAGRRVLVTGAGGSIGSELCRQLHALDPAALIMLDRDESALHGVELSIRGAALLTSPDTVLADIRDEAALMQVFEEAKPDIVFHAAALKHLPMLERFPLEGWKTNVHGTRNVLTAAQAVGVDTFVNISTDKAADPSSELGISKRIGERLVADVALTAPGTYLSVRFGNVLGSRGSVLMSFREQLASGGPLTVTHPDVTRYFMTIPEACQLVLQAGVIGESGCVMVLDMGTPVRIVDIAENLITLADADATIVFTGLRPGEKLDEVLFGDLECTEVQVHDRISRVRVPPLDATTLLSSAAPFSQVHAYCLAACADAGAVNRRVA